MLRTTLTRPSKKLILPPEWSLLPQYTMHRMRNNKKSKKKSHSTEQNTNSTNSTKSCFRCGEPYSKEHEPVCRAQEAFCNRCGKKGHFHIVCRSSGKFPQKQKTNSTNTKQTHYASGAPAQAPVGFYNEQGDWVSEPPRPSIKSMYSLSVVQPTPVIQDIQEIHPEPNPETSLTQGMAESQNFLSENSKTFTSSRDAVAPRTGSNLQAFPTEKQPIRQKLTNSFSSPVLQASKRSPRDQDIQNSTEVSVQSFRDTETDPETYSNADTDFSKSSPVSYFRDVPESFQRKGETVLQHPIDSTEFQQFCKKLNTKEIFLCRDLLEKELYGK